MDGKERECGNQMNHDYFKCYSYYIHIQEKETTAFLLFFFKLCDGVIVESQYHTKSIYMYICSHYQIYKHERSQTRHNNVNQKQKKVSWECMIYLINLFPIPCFDQNLHKVFMCLFFFNSRVTVCLKNQVNYLSMNLVPVLD